MLKIKSTVSKHFVFVNVDGLSIFFKDFIVKNGKMPSNRKMNVKLLLQSRVDVGLC